MDENSIDVITVCVITDETLKNLWIKTFLQVTQSYAPKHTPHHCQVGMIQYCITGDTSASQYFGSNFNQKLKAVFTLTFCSGKWDSLSVAVSLVPLLSYNNGFVEERIYLRNGKQRP